MGSSSEGDAEITCGECTGLRRQACTKVTEFLLNDIQAVAVLAIPSEGEEIDEDLINRAGDVNTAIHHKAVETLRYIGCTLGDREIIQKLDNKLGVI